MPTETNLLLKIYIYIIVFLLGSVLASFVTCAADRYAAGESVVRGRSKCPVCGRTLGVLDLIPVFSYIFLGGKCRGCGAKIPIRCLITELGGGAAYVLILWKFGLSFEALEMALLAPALLAVALIDYDTMEIPNGLVIYMAVLFVAFIWAHEPLERLKDGAIGAAAIGGGILVIALVMDKILKRESLGGGDVKLFFAIGLFTGVWSGLLAVILACVAGLVFALAMRNKKDGQFPFGPSICLAAFAALLFGQDVITLYMSLFI